MDSTSVLVRPEAAAQQLAAEQPPLTYRDVANDASGWAQGLVVEPAPKRPALPRRFFGRKIVDAVRLVRDASDIQEAIVQQLRANRDTNVRVVIEVEAEDDNGFAEEVQRTVSENARTLKFDEQEFGAS